MPRGGPVLVIGTSSEHRRAVLVRRFQGVFSDVRLVPPDVDEKAHRASSAHALTTLVALKKLEAVLGRLAGQDVESWRHPVAPAAVNPHQGNGVEPVTGHWAADRPSVALGAQRPTGFIVTFDQVAVPGRGKRLKRGSWSSAECTAVVTPAGAVESSWGPARGSLPELPTDVNVDFTEIREKPRDAAENRAFLQSYSNNSVITVGATVVHRLDTGVTCVGINETQTFFGPISEEVIDRILQRGISVASAGGFVVEDEDLSQCIAFMDGSLDEVRGVSVESVAELMDMARTATVGAGRESGCVYGRE